MTVADDSEWRDLHESTRRMGTFCVPLVSYPLMGSDAKKHLPVHDQVVAKLAEKATLCRVFRPYEIACDLFGQKIIHKDRGHVDIDPTGELVVGKEYLWNVPCRVRGSLLLAVPAEAFDGEFTALFQHTFKPMVFSSMAQVKKGHNPKALQLAAKFAGEGSIVFCFPSNNGIQWMDIFAGEDALEILLRAAYEHGKAWQNTHCW